jgi:hypothetical protein
MLNRFAQLGLAFALVSFAGFGTAQAQDEDPCSMGDPCADPCAEGDPCADPCAGGDEEGGDEAGGDEAGGDEDTSGDAAGPSMVTPKGKISINAGIGINLSDEDKGFGKVADPINISPDVVYGVMPKLDVGLYHSNQGLTGFYFEGLGGGVCIGDACAEAYNGPTGILARYEIVNGNVGVAGNGGVVLTNITDDADIGIRLKLGADVRYMINDAMGLMVNPNVHVNIAADDAVSDTHELYLPIGLMYAINDKIHAGLQTGIYALDIGELADTWFLPITVGGMMKIDDKLSVGGAIGLPIIASGVDMVPDGPIDTRTFSIHAKYNL